MLHRRPMLVNLIFYVLPFLRLVSALFNVTTALFSDGHIITGLWSEAMDCGYYTSTLNSSVSLTFKGVSIHVLGDLSLYGGTAHITLDDHPAQMIDLYGAASCGQVLFSRTGLANGEHSLKLALTGESPNMTSTDGPDRLLVLTNFIWSSLAPTLLSPSAELPLPAPFSQPLMPRSPLPAPPSDQPLPPPSTQPPPPPPSSDQPLPPPSTQPPPPPPSSDQPLPPPSTQPPSPSSTPEPPIPSPSSQPLSPSLSPSIQSSSLLPPSSSPPVSPSSPSSPSSASSSLRSSSSALSSSLLFSPSSSLTSRSPTQLSSVPTQLSPVPTQLSSVPTQLSTKSPSSFTTSSKYVIPPTSTLPPESVPTVTAVAAGPAPDLSPVLQLWTCKPYGPNDCAFIPQAAAGLNDFSLIVGTPASNCGGGTANLIAVVGGQLSITDTWSQDLSAGLSLGNAAGDLILNISGTQTWQNSQIRRSIEVVNMTIPPERQGALVAQVTYSTTNGMLQIGDQSPFSVLANQPQNGIQYQANIIPCNNQFSGNYTPPFSTTSAATPRMKPYGHAIVIIVALAVRVLL